MTFDTFYRARPGVGGMGRRTPAWLFFTFFRPWKMVSLNRRVWEQKRALGTLQGSFWRLHGLPKSVISLQTSSKNQLFHEFASKTPCHPLLARFQVVSSPKIRPKREPQGGVREPWFSLKTLKMTGVLTISWFQSFQLTLFIINIQVWTLVCRSSYFKSFQADIWTPIHLQK